MARRITQRELRNESGEVMRGLDRGEEFLVTRNGVAVGLLEPLRRRSFVAAEQARAAFRGAAPMELSDLRSDLDTLIEQGFQPRG